MSSLHLLKINVLKTQLTCCTRTFVTCNVLNTRKGLKPFDRRYDINPLDVDPKEEGGSQKLVNYLNRRGCVARDPGYYDANDKFHFVPEMMPEFIVPDLKDFELKPYVSYKVTDITQTEFTSKDLFAACYGTKIKQAYNESKELDRDALLQSERTLQPLRKITASDK